MTTPGPDPVAVAVNTEDRLTGFVVAVQQDSAAVAPAIKRRVTQSREADSVCMMGGWTS